MTLWAHLGETLGVGFFYFAFFFLLLGTFGLHVLVWVLCWALQRHGRGRIFRFSVEVLYGFVNPVVYLCVLQPGLLREVTPQWLHLLSCLVLGVFWTLRTLGSMIPLSHGARRRTATAVTLAAATLVFALSVRDVVFARQLLFDSVEAAEATRPLWLLGISPLYLLPTWAAFSQFQQVRRFEDQRSSGAFFVESRGFQVVFAALSFLCFGCFVSLSVRPSEDAARQLVMRHRTSLEEAARSENVEVRLLASVLLVTARDQGAFGRRALEETLAHAWLTDATSHTPMSGLNPSLGLMQIKPVTLLTANWIAFASDQSRDPASNAALVDDLSTPGFYKQYRDVSREAVRRIAATDGFGALQQPPFLKSANKPEVVSALLDDAKNIRSAAFILNIYSRQWAANPAWSVRERPEILATLFQIGFEKSFPKPSPRPSDFGQAVLREYEGAWMASQFSSKPLACP